jgi:Platelet-activating factor acetylhydrolase, isoform II
MLLSSFNPTLLIASFVFNYLDYKNLNSNHLEIKFFAKNGDAMRYFFYVQFLSIFFNHAAFAQTPQTLQSLPMPTGPYQIGVTKYDLRDSFRKEIENPAGRLIPIQIYFPIKKGAQILHNKIFEERVPGNWPPLEVKVYSQKADLSLLVDELHPLILLNHGDTVAMTDYAYIAEDLASHGYVVVAIQHQLRTDPDEPKL